MQVECKQISDDRGIKPARVLRYVLITPARNEVSLIESTLRAMVTQTVLPMKWVIVSDGSTDGTDELVQAYAARHSWIELVRMPERKERHFGGKVLAFNAGYEKVKNLSYQVIGNLDADSSFEPDYIEYLLAKFEQHPRLGVAGTNYVEDGWDDAPKHDYRFASIEDVTGQCQLFRRECFEAIGGYKPSKQGGIDLLATVDARMHGWQTRVFTDRILHHHRKSGTATVNRYVVEFQNGRKDFLFGCSLLYHICRSTYRLGKKPVILGGCLLFFGYFSAMLSRVPKTFPEELVRFRRREQKKRLKQFVSNAVGMSRT